ncbi:hypothetical protein RND81_02G032600 [Saponaria officinalis]|uniref:Uncharacterized protein n=1 Tax=Saponaria officinalis TaxID=3572 RepID=A0AAW1MQH9_SAPOF
MASNTPTEAATATAAAAAAAEDMDIKSVIPSQDTANGEKRVRNEEDEAEIADENDVVSKKQKVEDGEHESIEEVVEKESENVGPAGLGPMTFETSMEMFNYFYKFLHHWPLNMRANKYEYQVLLDLIKKGHPEPEKKIGSGINAFEIRYHPKWQSRCFFVVRDDKSAEDFSFRKCVDQILPLPENMKMKSDGNSNGNRSGGGGRGGGRGRGGRRGGGFRR